MLSSFALHFAQVATNAAGAADAGASTTAAPQGGPPGWTMLVYILLFGGLFYFGLMRPQQMAKKKAEDTVKAAKTGDKIVTSSGIHGVITNVKDSTVIVKVADNVKLEIEKSHIDKITRTDSPIAEKTAPAKA
jgi:preprotein translocase subunit YajC